MSGCGDSNNNLIYLNIQSVPETIDPQLAKSDEELMICRNLFEGLLRKNKDGKIVNGVCKSYEKNGLTYTFDLREGAKWSNKSDVTADDFVFAFRRAVTPSVKAPFARRLRNIKNAPAILNGTSDPSVLGVTATSSGTLVIELTKEDEFFEETLTTPVCMPCNSSFFDECEGKYGRDKECVISNGSYYLRRWFNEEFGMRLIKSETYSGDFESKNGGIVITANDETPTRTLFSKDSVDCAFVDNKDVDAVRSTGANCSSTQNICWLMTIGSSYSGDIRNAFAMSVSPDVYSPVLPTGFSAARSVYPGVLGITDADGIGLKSYDIESAKTIFSNAVKKMDDKVFPQAIMYYYADDCMLPVTKSVVAHFQQNLSAFINISPAKHPQELKGELKASSLQFAMFPVKATSADVSEYLVNFGSFDGVAPAAAQQAILSAQTVIPICFENTNLCYSNALSNMVFENFNGYIDFSFVIKK